MLLPSSEGLNLGSDPSFMSLLMRCGKKVAEREALASRRSRQWGDGWAGAESDGDEGEGAGLAVTRPLV